MFTANSGTKHDPSCISTFDAAPRHCGPQTATPKQRTLLAFAGGLFEIGPPFSGDLENGFGATPREVAETYRQAAVAGLVGASIEDAIHGPDKDALFDIGGATERIAAAVEATRKLGFPFLLTARADGFLHGHTNLDNAIRRLQAYEKAGADVLMAPGLPDLNSVKAVCAAITKPFSVLARPGSGVHFVRSPHRRSACNDRL